MGALVVAVKDIRSDGGLCVARAGAVGHARRGLRPHEPNNWGKVAVRWNGRKRLYWAAPALLRFPKGADAARYTAVRPASPFASVSLPLTEEPHEFDFGQNLKLCREARGWPQKALAERMSSAGFSTTQSTVCYQESKATPPGGRFVGAAARALGVPPCVLFLDLRDCASFGKARAFLEPLAEVLCGE